MISPMDVAEIIANIMTDDRNDDLEIVYELEGPAAYSSNEVAGAFSEVLRKPVKVQPIDRAEWENSLKSMGFSPDGIKNFVEMTEAVIAGIASLERNKTISVKGKTTLKEYLEKEL